MFLARASRASSSRKSGRAIEMRQIALSATDLPLGLTIPYSVTVSHRKGIPLQGVPTRRCLSTHLTCAGFATPITLDQVLVEKSPLNLRAGPRDAVFTGINATKSMISLFKAYFGGAGGITRLTQTPFCKSTCPFRIDMPMAPREL